MYMFVYLFMTWCFAMSRLAMSCYVRSRQAIPRNAIQGSV